MDLGAVGVFDQPHLLVVGHGYVQAGFDARDIEAAIAPILWSQPSTVLRRKHEVVLVGHGMVLRVVMHHIESTGTEINEAASGRRLRYRYFSETLQRLVNLNAFVGQAEATGLIRIEKTSSISYSM